LIVITQKQWVQANRANNSKTMGYSQETSRVTTTNSVHNAASLSMLCCFWNKTRSCPIQQWVTVQVPMPATKSHAFQTT
jgi:hypothetical protein